MSLLPTEEDKLKDLLQMKESNELSNVWINELIEENNELKEINEYYHDWTEKMMLVFHFLKEDLEVKYDVKLPESVMDDIDYFMDYFQFKYIKDKDSQF